MQLSIVIPVYNEAESLTTLLAELREVAAKQALELDIVFVDDGSTDTSWETIRNLAATNPGVRGLRFRRNFGKAAALSAGFREAKADLVMTMDGDLQDDPAEIPNFLRVLQEQNLDVVSGWKKKRHDPWHKVGPSRVFNFLVSRLTGVKLHDHNCGMKLYKAAIFREVRIYGELHRFIPVLAQARGFKVGEVVINHRPRKHGSSKYGFSRFTKGFLDLLTVKFLTSYGQRPQHLLGTFGLLAFSLGLLGMFYLAIIWLIRLADPNFSEPLHNRPLLIYSAAALLLGAQMMSIGFLAELITAHRQRDEDSFSIAEQASSPHRAAEEGQRA
jgi:dolichol-phosphate mannosyltransferase